MRIGNHEFDIKNDTYIMGILNVTPDSFSDGGRFNQLDAALAHTKQMIEEGATIIDVGGESTRPGYTKISDEEEIGRVVPVIRAIKEQFDIPVSIDTYKSAVAEAAIEAGADLVNDIWGLKYDPKMADVIARHDVACCLMHNRDNMDYNDFMEDMLNDLRETIAIAKKAGIADDKIMLDPGVGFAKSYENNLVVVHPSTEELAHKVRAYILNPKGSDVVPPEYLNQLRKELKRARRAEAEAQAQAEKEEKAHKKENPAAADQETT